MECGHYTQPGAGFGNKFCPQSAGSLRYGAGLAVTAAPSMACPAPQGRMGLRSSQNRPGTCLWPAAGLLFCRRGKTAPGHILRGPSGFKSQRRAGSIGQTKEAERQRASIIMDKVIKFDVFLSHNSKDKPAVRKLAEQLRKHGLKVWLDEWELRPGQPWQEAIEEILECTKSAIVAVGKDGLGPWQDREMRGCLSEFVKRNISVIPVLLADCPTVPKLPFF